MRLVSTSFLFGEDCANTWINIFLEHLRTPLRLYAGPAAQTRQTVFLVADSFTMGPKCLLSTRNIATFPEKETDKEKKCGHENHLQKSILETTRVSFSKTISQPSSLLFGSSFLIFPGRCPFFFTPPFFCRSEGKLQFRFRSRFCTVLHAMGFGDPQKISWNELMTLDLSLTPCNCCFRDDSPAKVEKTCILALFFFSWVGKLQKQ